MAAVGKVALQEEDSDEETQEELKLWIGNLDKCLTEYQLLQILQKHGNIKKFEFLFHMHGPAKGEPRGYCFVEYETKEESEKVKAILNGKQILSKKIVVDWAKKRILQDETPGKSKPQNKNERTVKETTRENKIQAIEAKLRRMEKGEETSTNVIRTINIRTERQFQRNKPHPYQSRHKRPRTR